MGEEIGTERFGATDRERFAARCREGLQAVERLLARPGFGAGPPSIGLELEIGLVDAAAQPAPVNAAVIDALADPRVEHELDRFNLELATEPRPMAGRPLAALGDDMARGLEAVRGAAAAAGARPVCVGILPTLRTDHLGPEAMSDSPRFRALGRGLRALRGGPFHIDIDGEEPLRTTWDDLTLEGAATGMHIHLRVPPSAFPAVFNAAQLAVAPVLAASANSPLLLGHRLWRETRVALFGQAVDDRAPVGAEWLPSRASFGHGWIASPLEPFAESVALHEPLLPVVGEEEPLTVAQAGGVPRLDELRLHHGTVWRWNRAVIDVGPDDPHLRIEMRALPAGPSVADMRANAAFLIGLTAALAPQMEWMARSMPFALARRNFYAAAREGLGAVVLWPASEAPSPRPWPAPDLIPGLLAAARVGLVAWGVDPAEADAELGVVAARVAAGASGAEWQRRALTRLEEEGRDRPTALAALTEAYIDASASGAPVHRWALP